MSITPRQDVECNTVGGSACSEPQLFQRQFRELAIDIYCTGVLFKQFTVDISYFCFATAPTTKFVGGIEQMGEMGGMGFSPFESIIVNIFPIFIAIIFIIVFGGIIFTAVKSLKQYKKNNDSPVLTVDATVVTKRTDVHHHHHSAGTDNMNHMSSSHTTYYVTFEVASGDRMEFEVRDNEYGMLVEKDVGKLTFQGTRYLSFERVRS